MTSRNYGSEYKRYQKQQKQKKDRASRNAARRKSFCARSAGQMKKFPKAARDPNSRLRQARKRWRC